mmetsp:Transcript_34980/g.90622  ORF Transcript_34980/g.90622 Transcript_34980/m.90622 type:complete len:85 (+) Transcript_34980:79-333(+)
MSDTSEFGKVVDIWLCGSAFFALFDGGALTWVFLRGCLRSACSCCRWENYVRASLSFSLFVSVYVGVGAWACWCASMSVIVLQQ